MKILPSEKEKEEFAKAVEGNFNEKDHPRGQPNNAGQFVRKGEGGSKSQKDEKSDTGKQDIGNVWPSKKPLEIDRSNEPAIKQAKKIEGMLRDYDEEVGSIIDPKTGKMINQSFGGNNYVQIPIDKMKNMIVTHNHPTGGIFTPDDVDAFIKGQALEIRASASTGETYSLRREKQGNVDPNLFSDYNNIANQHTRSASEYSNQMGTNKKEKDMIFAEKMTDILNPWLQENAHNYGCIFTVEK